MLPAFQGRTMSPFYSPALPVPGMTTVQLERDGEKGAKKNAAAFQGEFCNGIAAKASEFLRAGEPGMHRAAVCLSGKHTCVRARLGREETFLALSKQKGAGSNKWSRKFCRR